MRRHLAMAGSLILAILFTVGSVDAATWKLVAVTYPEKKSVDVPFDRAAIAPKAAVLKAEVRYQGGQAQIELSWDKMEPAVMFAGNITSYALWAVTRDGRPENLGEVPVREKKSGSAIYRTGQKNFGMIVTAEVLPGTLTPTELVLFTSGKVDPKSTAVAQDFTIEYENPFRDLVRPGNPSIAELTYTPGGEPVELQQARKALEMAETAGAAKVDEKSMKAAKIELEQATNSMKSGGSSKAVVDYSRRALENAGVAIRLTLQKRMDEAAAAEEARRKAAEEAKRRELEAAKAKAGAAQAEAARMAAEVERLKTERETLRKSLQDAVGQAMGITQTARGVVVNMGEITFDVNKSSLKRDAELNVAKISGILAVFQRFYIRVEGYTDTTGKQDLNMKLSAERARTVSDFLVAQGIAAARVTHAGYGPANPAESNDTAEGRAKNRRVEIIVNETPVEPTPGGMVAPERPAKATKPAAKPAEKPAPAKAAEPKKPA